MFGDSGVGLCTEIAKSGRETVKGASRAGSQRGEGTPIGTSFGVYLIYTGLPCREYSQ